ncbi:MAG: PASTA domain-containing protein [Actinobacteria bacterium]|nr:PASTA domain-containing protein [Actinomycetota bacterium]MCL5886734.1 PASTA domain-containing protein [Actinomycetota bacterium]
MSDRSTANEDRRSKSNLLFGLLFLVVLLIVFWLLWSWWQTQERAADRVAQAEELIAVPDVVGIRRSAAVNRLNILGFQADYRSDTTVDARPGDVAVQDPPAGTLVERGSLVRLTISAASATVVSPLFPEEFGDERRVPNVMGWTERTAINQLETAGFRVSVSEGYSDSFSPDAVMRQRPSGGTTLTVGSTVAITMSLGTRPVGRIPAPDVMGLTESAAVARIRAAGLRAVPTYQPADDNRIGLVNDQTPFAGERIRTDGTVIIVVGVAR